MYHKTLGSKEIVTGSKNKQKGGGGWKEVSETLEKSFIWHFVHLWCSLHNFACTIFYNIECLHVCNDTVLWKTLAAQESWQLVIDIVHTLMATLLHTAFDSFNHVGKSSKSVRTFSSSSRLLRSPSPFKVLTWILSGARFFVNLDQR